MTPRARRILIIADAVHPVPPLNYGGAERIVAYLCGYLGKRGYLVDLLAKAGSMKTTGTLYTHRLPTPGKLSRGITKARFWYESLRLARSADAIINFGRLDYLAPVIRYSNRPLMCVFQNPAHQSEVDYVLRSRKTGIRFIGVSHSQFQGIKTSGLLEIIHNVSSIVECQPTTPPMDKPYLAFLGRLTANKGVHLAIQAARQAQAHLKIAGTIAEDEPEGREYFRTQVKPYLDSQIEYVGPVNDVQKCELLSGAAALLFPIQWNEPCALVLPESLSYGCPVIGWNIACVPEIIDNGITGFLVNSIEEMVAAIAKVDLLSRERCKQVAERKFSVQSLGMQYERILTEMITTS